MRLRIARWTGTPRFDNFTIRPCLYKACRPSELYCKGGGGGRSGRRKWKIGGSASEKRNRARSARWFATKGFFLFGREKRERDLRGWRDGGRDGKVWRGDSSRSRTNGGEEDRFQNGGGLSLPDGRGHWDQGIGSRNKLPVDRPSPSPSTSPRKL